MAYTKLQCPNCNAVLDIAKDRKEFFCPYCGAKVLNSDQSSYSYTYQSVDEARIREANSHETIRLKELELEEKKLRMRHILITAGIIVLLALIYIISQGGVGTPFAFVLAIILIVRGTKALSSGHKGK